MPTTPSTNDKENIALEQYNQEFKKLREYATLIASNRPENLGGKMGEHIQKCLDIMSASLDEKYKKIPGNENSSPDHRIISDTKTYLDNINKANTTAELYKAQKEYRKIVPAKKPKVNKGWTALGILAAVAMTIATGPAAPFVAAGIALIAPITLKRRYDELNENIRLRALGDLKTSTQKILGQTSKENEQTSAKPESQKPNETQNDLTQRLQNAQQNLAVNQNNQVLPSPEDNNPTRVFNPSQQLHQEQIQNPPVQVANVPTPSNLQTSFLADFVKERNEQRPGSAVIKNDTAHVTTETQKTYQVTQDGRFSAKTKDLGDEALLQEICKACVSKTNDGEVITVSDALKGEAKDKFVEMLKNELKDRDVSISVGGKIITPSKEEPTIEVASTTRKSAKL